MSVLLACFTGSRTCDISGHSTRQEVAFDVLRAAPGHDKWRMMCIATEVWADTQI